MTRRFRRSFPQWDKHGAMVVSPNHIVLLTTLFKNEPNGYPSKKRLYSACSQVAQSLGWHRKTSMLQHALKTVPDGLVRYTYRGAAVACRITKKGKKSLLEFINDDSPVRLYRCDPLAASPNAAHEQDIRLRLRSFLSGTQPHPKKRGTAG